MTLSPDDRAYLERRREHSQQKAAGADDPGLARVYRNFADMYARAITAEAAPVMSGPAEPEPPFMLRD